MHPLRRTIVVKYLMVLPVSSRSTCPVVLLGWLECGRAAGRGEGINRERRVKSTPRERTSARHICFCAGKKWPRECVFSHYLIRSLRQRRSLAEWLCSPRISIHGNINSIPAPYLHGDFFCLFVLRKGCSACVLWHSPLCRTCTPSSWVIIATARKRSRSQRCICMDRANRRARWLTPLNSLRQSSRHDVWICTDWIANVGNVSLLILLLFLLWSH